jgi:hypothetical protein
MDASEAADYIIKTFPDVETGEAYGYTFFFFKSDHKLPFATLIASDTEYDRVSNLDRPGVYRLNIGVSRETFEALFGSAKVDVKNYDYAALDIIMPHPDYAPQNFVCVLSPTTATWDKVQGLLAEAYGIAKQRFERQHREEGRTEEEGGRRG